MRRLRRGRARRKWPWRSESMLRRIRRRVGRMKTRGMVGGAWFASAGEKTASSELNDNNPDLAGPLFAASAKDKDAPASARSRAAQMAVALGIDVAPDQAAGEAGATE